MSTRLSRVRILLGASMFATLALLLAGLGVNGHAGSVAALAAGRQAISATGTASPSTSPGAPQPTPNAVSAVNLAKADSQCANQQNHKSGPYIEFCAPSFGGDASTPGNIEGPWGSHITLVLDSTGLPVQEIYLFAVSPSAQNECATIGTPAMTFANGSEPATDQLVTPLKGGPVTLSFTWTFGKDPFDITNDYCLAAKFRGHDSVSSTTGFSLLSFASPCVTISDSQTPPACAQGTSASQDTQVLAGSKIQVAGDGWLPGNLKQQVEFSLACVSGAQCSKSDFSLGSLPTSGAGARNTGGDLGPDTLQIPADAVGKFRLQASAASGAITFGDSAKGDAQTITLNIVAHPCIALGGSCTWSGTDAPQSMTKAQSATIMLQNWKSGGKVSVYLVPGAQTAQGCKPSAALGKQQTLVPSNNAIGQAFTLPGSLQVGKTYTVCATGQSTVGGDAVTAAMPVRVVKAVAHPLFSLLSLLALLFGLVSVAAYALTTRQRVASPQPVARR